MLRDCNGRPYKASGKFQHFNPDSPEHNLFNLWDEEAIRIGGSPIYYYDVFLQASTIDQIYLEDRGKIYSNVPIELYGYYEPITSQNAMSVFGIDSPDDIVFYFNYRSVLRTLGKPPQIFSRLYTPHKREDWLVIQRNVSEFKLWGELRLELLCKRFQETVTTGSGRVTQPKPDFKIN